MNDSIKNGECIGSSCLVFQNEKLLYSGSAGYFDASKMKPMQTDTICRLFSLTKPITSTAAMMAIDKGLFAPDTELSQFFPEYSNMRYSVDSPEIKDKSHMPPITIKHLLNMTAGLPYPSDWCDSVRSSGNVYEELSKSRKEGRSLSTQDFAKKCASIPLYNIPGDYWFYGVEADILAAVIEKASGIRYSEYLRKNIFDPLEMNDTDFYVPPHKQNRLSAIYQHTDSGLLKIECDHLGIIDFSTPPVFESGGAGIFSTINDYSIFAKMLCNFGVHNNKRLISEKSFEYMTTPKFNQHLLRSMWDRLEGYNYSCFMRVMTDVENSHIHSANGEFGWDGWSGTYFCVHPESGITVLYFTQICHGATTKQAMEIVDTVFMELL